MAHETGFILTAFLGGISRQNRTDSKRADQYYGQIDAQYQMRTFDQVSFLLRTDQRVKSPIVMLNHKPDSK